MPFYTRRPVRPLAALPVNSATRLQCHLTSPVLLLPNPKKLNRDPSGDWHSYARCYVRKWPLSPPGLCDLWS
jgi:hypothetical protein